MEKPSLTIRPAKTGVRERLPVNGCNHKYIHFSTKKNVGRPEPYQRKWIRVDQFFCEQCCDTKTVRKEEYNRDMPEWY
jgi:hypothetical protein